MKVRGYINKMSKAPENKLVDLVSISEEARGILVKAAGFNHLDFNERMLNEDYLKLYHDFQKATHYKYKHNEGEDVGKSFDRFQVGATRMSRRLATLNYKQDGDYETKEGFEYDKYNSIRKALFKELKI